MGKTKPGLQMIMDKKWQDLEPGECTFWRYRENGKYWTVLVVACPKCGEPAEVDSCYGIVNWGKEQIHIIRPLVCPGEGCRSKYYCHVGRFEFIRKKQA